jgi:hypothetical protein
MDANFEEVRAIMDAYYDREGAIMDAYYENMIAIIKEGLRRAEDRRKPTPEETTAVAEP